MRTLAREATIFALLGTIAMSGCGVQTPQQVKVEPQMRLSLVQLFDLRTKCQAIVDKDVEDYLIGSVGNALVSETTSHYNPVTNHCYADSIATKNFSFKWPKTPNNYRTDALYDAHNLERSGFIP